MSHKMKGRMFIGLLLLIVLVGCSSQSVSQPRSTLTDVGDLVEGLQNAGAMVELNGTLTQPLFSPEGLIVSVNGADIQVFVFTDEALAEEEVEKISPDGSVGTTQVFWVDTPHFYHQGNLIVLYIGQDTQITTLLESVLGEQISG